MCVPGTVIGIETISLRKTDVIPYPVESSGDIIKLHLIHLDSNKTASERFKVGIQNMTFRMLVCGNST